MPASCCSSAVCRRAAAGRRRVRGQARWRHRTVPRAVPHDRLPGGRAHDRRRRHALRAGQRSPARCMGRSIPVVPSTPTIAETGVPVWRPPLTGRINAFVIADGRFVVGGRNVHAGAVERYGLMELTRTGIQRRGIRACAYAPPGPPGGGADGGVSEDAVHGNVLVAAGASGPDVNRVAVFALSGATAPSGLRSRSAAGVVQRVGMHPPPRQPAATCSRAPSRRARPRRACRSARAPRSPRRCPCSGRPSSACAGKPADVSNGIVVGCVAPPQPPTSLTTTMNGNNLALSWSAPLEPVSVYTFNAGAGRTGLSDAARFPLPGTRTSVTRTGWHLLCARQRDQRLRHERAERRSVHDGGRARPIAHCACQRHRERERIRWWRSRGQPPPAR